MWVSTGDSGFPVGPAPGSSGGKPKQWEVQCLGSSGKCLGGDQGPCGAMGVIGVCVLQARLGN